MGISGLAPAFQPTAAGGVVSPAEAAFTQEEAAGATFDPALGNGGEALWRQARRFENTAPVVQRPHTLLADRSRFQIGGREISLEELLAGLQVTVPGYHLHFLSIKQIDEGVRVSLGVKNARGAHAAQCRFIIRPMPGDPSTMQDLYSDMQVTHRGNGLGIALIVRYLLLLRRLGFCRLEIIAGRMGIYYWPSRGFDFGNKDIRHAVIEDFLSYATIAAANHGFALTEWQRQKILPIKHAWELAHWVLNWGEVEVPIGKKFLQSPIYNKLVVVCFEFRDDYGGWLYLRRALEKAGQAHWLPDGLGVPSASVPSSPLSLRRQSSGSMENVARR